MGDGPVARWGGDKDTGQLYAAAEAYAGVGNLASLQARKTSKNTARYKLWNDACVSYEKSLSTWTQISNPSRVSGNGYLASDPKTIALRLADCKAHLYRP